MKKLREFPNYYIDEYANIFNSTGRVLRKKTDKDGYKYIGLYKNSKQFFRRICRLVADTYIPNLDNKETVNHIDGKKDNDIRTNLEWASHSEQIKHAHKIGLINQRGEKNPASKITNDQAVLIRKLKAEGKGCTEIAKDTGINYYTLRHIYYNKTFISI